MSAVKLKVREGFVVGISWKEGEMVSAEIHSKLGNPLTVKYKDIVTQMFVTRNYMGFKDIFEKSIIFLSRFSNRESLTLNMNKTKLILKAYNL